MKSLRSQLLISHIFLVLLMAAVTGSAIYSLRGIESTFSKERIGDSRAARGAQLVDAALMEQRTALWLLLSGSTQECNATFHSSWDTFDAGVKLIRSPGTDSQTSAEAERLEQAVATYRVTSQKVVESNSVSLLPTTRQTVSRVLEPQIMNLRLQAQHLQDAARDAAQSDGAAAREASDAAIAKAAWMFLIGIFIAFGLGTSLVRAAISPLKDLVARAEKIAKGDLSPRPLSDRNDEIGALGNAVESMTESLREMRAIQQKRVRRAEQMSDTALEHLYDPVVVLDQKMRIVHLNHAAESLLGKIPEDQKVLVGDHIQDRRLAKALCAACISHKVSASEEESASLTLTSNGVRKSYRLKSTPIKDEDGVPIGSVAILEDITHFREIDRLKNEFIGVASHELRTPVSSLLLSAQLLKDGAVGPLTAEQLEIVNLQLQDLERLEKLMKDLLDVTKLAAGMTPPRLEAVNVADLYSVVVQNMKSQATAKGVRLFADGNCDEVEIFVDKAQIGRVLTNLIANAIRHTKSGGSVQVGAILKPNDVTFYVRDTGEGIPLDYLNRIFDRFVQVPGATQGGAGLGLSIAQNIVKAHCGYMSVESKLEEGSVFSFTLPRNSEASDKEKIA